MSPDPQRGKLLALAVEGIVPVLAGCAGAVAGGPEGGMVGGMVGVAVGQSVEKVINFFGGRIVEQWAQWFRKQTPDQRDRALTDLAALTPEEARHQAEALLDRLVLEPLLPADRELALSYLTLLPGSLDRALSQPVPGGVRTLSPTISAEEPQQLLSLLPLTLPPYPIGAEVPGTPYRLDALLGTGGFGAVYRASTRSLQHLPLAIKFCLDPGLAQALHRERENLERLMKAGGENWSPRIVRLYGYDLEHETPYLVYEFVTGGDLIRHLGQRQQKLGRVLDAAEVLAIVTQVAEALAFAHDNGLVHRDLKPANVLVEAGVIKLADFGLGGITAARAAQQSRIGSTTVDLLSLADQASLFRGAGTPLYMAPEQRRGLPPDPRHDLFSLGVMWYQLLIGDVSRELHPGWAKELTVRYRVPASHIRLIDACVGWFDERPKNAGELLRQMRDVPPEATIARSDTPVIPVASYGPAPQTQALLANLVKKLVEAYRASFTLKDKRAPILIPAGLTVLFAYIIASAERFSTGATVALALFVGGLAAGLAALVFVGRRAEARVRLTTSIATLEREFPAVVAGWGGSMVLHDRQLVEQIARDIGVVIDPPPGATRESSGLTIPPGAVDTVRRLAAVEQLRDLRQEQVRLARFEKRRHIAWPVAIGIGILFGVAVGSGIGAYVFNLASVDTAVMTTRAKDAYSQVPEISEFEMVRANRFARLLASLIGAGSGVVVAGVIGVALGYRPWFRWQLLLGLLVGTLIGAPIGSGVGIVLYQARSPFMTKSGLGRAFEFHLSSGATIPESTYYRALANENAHAALVSIATALIIALAVVFAWQLWYGRRARAAEVAVEEQARRTVEAFPALAALAGGVEGLSRPGSAQQLLLGLGVGAD